MKKNIKIIAFIAVIVMCAVVLASCVPQTVEKAEAKMKEADYLTVGLSDSDKGEGIVGGFIASKILQGEVVTAIWYSSAKEAREAYNDYKDKKEDKDTVVKRSGKCIYYGTAGAIKVFEGGLF